MLSQSHYYFESIKNYITAFSHIFNDIHVQRTDSAGTLIKDIVVPISYGQKSKLFHILERNANIGRKIDTILPRLDFELTTIEPDPTRQRNATLDVSQITDDEIDYSYTGVSYNFNFDVNLVCNYLDDMYQAIEQILAVFNPDYQNLEVSIVPELNLSHNVKVVLTGVELDITQDLGEEDFRSCESNFTFQLQGYLYKPVKTTGKIRKVIVNLENENEKTWTILTSELQADDVTIIDSIEEFDQ